MARPLKYPFTELRADGDSVTVPANPHIQTLARQYAQRNGFAVRAESAKDADGNTVRRITRVAAPQ